MNDFVRAVKFIIEHEVVFKKGHYGDYKEEFVVTENVRGDRGGKTRYGIDQRSHPDACIDSLTLEQAKEIYRTEYWLKGKCDQMPWPVCLVHLDGCVNTGVGQAAKHLQRAIGADADGAVGPKTLALLKKACDESSPVEVANKIAKSKEAFYRHLAEQNEGDKEFLEGWLNRLSDVKKTINEPTV
jgi:lysozyme family protein